MYALLDCNNFFVSCERALDPNFQNVPVVVLSNNDGCVISRSNEAKELGIPMGAPFFKYKDFFEKNNVKVFSAKFELYNHYSTQIMRTVKEFVPEYEVYSIDEVFLDLRGFKYFNLDDYSKKIKDEVLKKFNIPVSIGIAPTKTLCKVANRIAKKNESFLGVYSLDNSEKISHALKNLKIENVWGIGRRYSTKFHDMGIFTCADFLKMPEIWIRKQMGINGVRMIQELKGNPQLILEAPQKKQSIATTRSFMEMITQKEDLAERIETFAMHCAEKLRKQNSCCKSITVFIQTNRFRKDLPSYYNSATVTLSNPSSSTIIICKEVLNLFEKIFSDGYYYKKAGVIVSDFVEENERIVSLFEKDFQEIHAPIMKVMDRMNQKYGKGKIHLGASSGANIYGRTKLSEEYKKALLNNTYEESNYRFH